MVECLPNRPRRRPQRRACCLARTHDAAPRSCTGAPQITAGEEIDVTLGVRFGLSTLAAAGLGNLVADVAGIGFANSIEVGRPLLSLAGRTCCSDARFPCNAALCRVRGCRLHAAHTLAVL
jgi:hypothetical protein